MKLKIISVIIAVFMLVCVFGSFYIDSAESISSVSVIVDTAEGTQDISLFKNNNIYYAFLPSYADLSSARVESRLGYSVYLNGLESDSVTLEKDKEYNVSLEGVLGIVVAEEKLVIKQSENVAALSIHLADGTIADINKDVNVEKSGILSLITADSKVDYSGSFAVLGGRGNSSWGQVKKPYNLRFNREVSLLGMEASLNWVLVANAMDESNIRNKLVYDSAINAGLDNSVASEFVDLYVDGEYLGLYLLTERIEVGESRIDITDLYQQTQQLNQYRLDTYEHVSLTDNGVFQKAFSIPNDPADITGGYLLEFELSGRREQEPNLFTTVSGQDITVKSPKNASLAQMNYISSFTQLLENSLGTHEVFNYIDGESWARYYLIQEFFGNISRTSVFFYKDSDAIDGKLYAGPIWDFDLSVGTAYGSKNTTPNSFFINTWGWFKELYNNEEFYNLLVEEYKNTLRPIFVELIEETAASCSEAISKSYEMNELRWQDSQYNWWVNRYDSQAEHVEYITDFLSTRLLVFDDVFINGIPCETVVEKYAPDEDIPSEEGESPNDGGAAPQEQPSGGLIAKLKSVLRKIYNNISLIIVGVIVVTIAAVMAMDFIPVLKRRFKRGKDV